VAEGAKRTVGEAREVVWAVENVVGLARGPVGEPRDVVWAVEMSGGKEAIAGTGGESTREVEVASEVEVAREEVAREVVRNVDMVEESDIEGGIAAVSGARTRARAVEKNWMGWDRATTVGARVTEEPGRT